MAPELSFSALDLFFNSHPWHGNILVQAIPIGGLGLLDHPACEITRVYGREEAHEVIRRSQQDYLDRFGAVLGDIVPRGAR